MINGELSEPYVVTRGVRQGDPLSCLLFNLAIEPLACLLRKSDIEGVAIPGTNKTLVVSLFADDTTIYLKSTDSMETLWSILCLWCAASTAKFNEHKTVLLPFGRSSYRQKVLGERRINDHSPIGDINTTIRIVPDGESCRILGAWIGNNIPYTTPWPSVLEKINTNLLRWQAPDSGREASHN